MVVFNPPTVQPPFRCILCGNGKTFNSEEHIVPHSLGNDLVVLAPGWLCDVCNNVCSKFESRVLSESILGVERCRLGVVTKKRKPATACVHGISWFSEPLAPPNVVSAQTSWNQIPIVWSANNAGKIILPLHDSSNHNICRLLLKIGVELLAVYGAASCSGPILGDFQQARDVILGLNSEPWPYAVLLEGQVPSQMVSVFESTPDEHEYILSCGFDLFLHEVEEHKIMAFNYGHFVAAISLVSRNTNWFSIFKIWNTRYVGCPARYQSLVG